MAHAERDETRRRGAGVTDDAIEQIREPYLGRALDWFGPERCMFGSDWPVCLLAAGYGAVLELLLAALDGLSRDERATVLGGTATRTYALQTAHADAA